MENDLENALQPSAKEQGDALELAIEHIFKVGRFATERNVVIANYQIDVKATIGDRAIVIECKNYQNSGLTIRNLIHQWNSKNQILRAHKIILVLIGLTIKESDYVLASEFDMELWNENDLTELFNLSLKPDLLKKKLLSKISLKPLTISERYREEITFLVIKPILTGYNVGKESLYRFFNKWLRSYILTELQMVETTRDERDRHIELFEGTKMRKGFLNILKERKEVDYWDEVYDLLATQNLLNNEMQKKYLSYMNDLTEEFNAQTQFFNTGNYYDIISKVIASRLLYASYHDQKCIFKTTQMTNEVSVGLLKSGYFYIQVTEISQNQANILNWILTCENRSIFDENKKSYDYFWIIGSINETKEKIIRIFTEYYEATQEDSIKDISISKF